MDIFIDCETAPTTEQWFLDEIKIDPPGNYKKPESIAKWREDNEEAERQRVIEKTAVDTSMARIICLCYAFEDEPVIDLVGNEKTMLEVFFEDLARSKGLMHSRLIGHNIINFDIPLIFHRAIINGITPHPAFHMHYTPWGGECFDTMTEWAGTKGRISQHNLARLLGIETQDTDGSQVPQLYADGKIDEIAQKCAFDVEQNRKIYRRITGRG